MDQRPETDILMCVCVCVVEILVVGCRMLMRRSRAWKAENMQSVLLCDAAGWDRYSPRRPHGREPVGSVCVFTVGLVGDSGPCVSSSLD